MITKLTRIWYIACVPNRTKKDRGKYNVVTYTNYPYFRDFPEGTTWETALPVISALKHRAASGSKTDSAMKIIAPKLYRFHSSTVVEVEDGNPF